MIRTLVPTGAASLLVLLAPVSARPEAAVAPRVHSVVEAAAPVRPTAPDRYEVAPELAARDPVARSFQAWLDETPGRADAVGRFAAYLEEQGVAGVAPIHELLLTASDWQRCGASEFDLPPPEDWPHIVPTLRYVADEVVPAVGPVTVRSGWRPASLNRCAGGAPKGAHPDYFALDMTPARDLSRADLHERLCAMWRRDGQANDVGLGLYGGVRFHIDTMRWRQWKTGPNGSVAACV